MQRDSFSVFGDRFSLSSRTHLIIPGLVARLACVRPFKNSTLERGFKFPFYIHLSHYFFYTDPPLLFPIYYIFSRYEKIML